MQQQSSFVHIPLIPFTGKTIDSARVGKKKSGSTPRLHFYTHSFKSENSFIHQSHPWLFCTIRFVCHHKFLKQKKKKKNNNNKRTYTIMMNGIIELNNRAGHLLENGSYEFALLMYREALIILKEHEQRCQQEEQQDECDETVSTATAASATFDELPISSRKQRSLKKNLATFEEEESNNNNEGDFVYQSPIQVSAEDFKEHQQAFYESELNCIILFNMALAYHLWALEGSIDRENTTKETTTISQRRLMKALKCYEMSFTMQGELGSVMSITSILALVNNCASIYKLLKREKRAKKFYGHMLSTIMAMIELDEASEVDQLAGFLYNVSKLVLRSNVAPAA
jgi:tetratricopeptide (TPR) repeat protein